MPLENQDSYRSFLEAIDAGSKSVTIASFLLNLVLSQSLGALWEAINSLQLMVHMSMFQAMVPRNVLLFDDRVQELVNFDFIPVDLVF